MATYSITLGYDGAPFCGFAKQPGQLTVQGELEHALSVMLHEDTQIVCAGRTDSGVHARAQVVSFKANRDVVDERGIPACIRSLNALTHDKIICKNMQERADDFSARFDAKEREYRYFIRDRKEPSIFLSDFSWQLCHALDIDSMKEGASHLIGEHDFKSFCLAVSAEGKRTWRCINAIDIYREKIMDEEFVVVVVKGNAFLHSMVRAIVGTLVAVGKGLREPKWTLDVLAAKDRRAAGENAPACGLVLWNVLY